MLQIEKYKSAGEFYRDAKAQNFSVPLPMLAGLSQLMQKKRMSFPEAYNFLLEREKLKLVENFYIYDLSACKLWE